ncbi:hypothetical protein CASFOL_000153 [Castilleja foliolosa]|uniref:Uncharacterized protein n=1 Tax=Castilleja foliolosa TaxID=1961234 RepID=A0ABD3EMU5_9LAMI
MFTDSQDSGRATATRPIAVAPTANVGNEILHRATNHYIPESLKGTIPTLISTTIVTFDPCGDPEFVVEGINQFDGMQLIACKTPITPELELKVELISLLNHIHHIMRALDLKKQEIRGDMNARSTKKVKMRHERLCADVPLVEKLYEEHDRGPKISNKSKFLDPHGDIDAILRLTKRHIDAILDKRIVEKDRGASVPNILPYLGVA